MISVLDASVALKGQLGDEEFAAPARVFGEDLKGEKLVRTIRWIGGGRGLREPGECLPNREFNPLLSYFID
jgi:hypothetical protein